MGGEARRRRVLMVDALRNGGVRLGERELASGVKLRGVYALRDFAPGDYVASYHGLRVPWAKMQDLHANNRPLFDMITEYGLGNPKDGFLYPENIDVLGAHLINHSCGANARWAQVEQGATLVRACKPIAAGDEVTIHYGWLGTKASYEKSWHPCACTAPLCTGTIELRFEFIVNDDGTGGPYLDREEVALRFLADIMNDCKDHEELLVRYGTSALDMVQGADVIERLPPSAHFAKLRAGAAAAIATARKAQAMLGKPFFESRLREIARTYSVPDGGGLAPPGRTGT